jgi:fumarylpyruvate hydrolase
MSDYVILPPPQASAAVEGEAARFPVRRILCVGRNYGAHVREMGGDETKQPPIFFAKPADAVRGPGESVPYPPATHDLHHEIELVVALKSGGAEVPSHRALELVFGYAAGVDLTRRDLQGLAKTGGQPWDAAKGFDASAPLGPIRRAEGSPPPQGRISLSVDGAVRQSADLADMIWSVPEIIAEASKLWTLAAGDLIFTGTPEGVGPVLRGQSVEGRVADLAPVAFTVV